MELSDPLSKIIQSNKYESDKMYNKIIPHNPLKVIRLGYSETSLLFIYYIKKYKKYNFTNDDNEFIDTLINWLYTTSGYYDKSIKGDYFNFDAKICINSRIYNNYMDKLLLNLNYSDILQLNFHKFSNGINSFKNDFINYFNAKKIIYEIDDNDMFDYMKNLLFYNINNKNILIINSFSKLIKKQIDTNINSLKKIYLNFPNIKNVYQYTTPYTFLNNGPNNSILDTIDNICKEIKYFNYNFDIAIISCGAYSSFIGNYIVNNFNKDIFITGGYITRFFGIMNKREIDKFQNFENKEYWITDIPNEYKPINFEKIENGCYW